MSIEILFFYLNNIQFCIVYCFRLLRNQLLNNDFATNVKLLQVNRIIFIIVDVEKLLYFSFRILNLFL